MYAVQALIGPYFKRGFISYTEACRHADDMTRQEGQPHDVISLTLLYRSKPSQFQTKAINDYKKAVKDALK